MADQPVQVYEELKQETMLSDIFAESGLFPDIKTKAQALVKVLAGKELGISPFESMASIYIVNGKLALTAKAMASLIKKSPNYDYTLEKLDDAECTIVFYQETSDVKRELGKSTFTFKDAAKAGLANKDNWKSYPRNMLFARALSNGCRWYCPEVISGYYAVEEIEDIVAVPSTNTIELTLDGEVKNGTL